MLWWLLRQLPRPVAVLASPWATHPRLRRAHLLHLWTRRPGRGVGGRAVEGQAEDLDAIFAAYDVFAGPQGERAGGNDFGTFCTTIADAAPDPAAAGRRQDLARAWRWHGLRREALAALAPATVVLTLALLVGSLAATVGGLVLAPPPTLPVAGAQALAAAGLGAALLALGRFLSGHLGDAVLLDHLRGDR